MGRLHMKRVGMGNRAQDNYQPDLNDLVLHFSSTTYTSPYRTHFNRGDGGSKFLPDYIAPKPRNHNTKISGICMQE
jgi:hypothetical protein